MWPAYDSHVKKRGSQSSSCRNNEFLSFRLCSVNDDDDDDDDLTLYHVVKIYMLLLFMCIISALIYLQVDSVVHVSFINTRHHCRCS